MPLYCNFHLLEIFLVIKCFVSSRHHEESLEGPIWHHFIDPPAM